MNSYYHTLGSGYPAPLGLLTHLISVQELQLVSGVVGSATCLPGGVRRDGLGTDEAPWHGVPSGTRMVGLGTLLTSFGAVSDTPAGSPCGWNPNRR